MKTEIDKPLVVLFQWLMAKPNHIKKYAQIYIDQGFDVVTVSITPWQVMWPTKGTQVKINLFIIIYAIVVSPYFSVNFVKIKNGVYQINLHTMCV